MAVTELLEQDVRSGITHDKQEAKLAQEMEQILEEAEQREAAEVVEPTGWGYRVPFAGVRYYTF